MAVDMIEMAFAVQGRSLPPEHRLALTRALQRVLPWLGDLAGAGVHRLKLVASGEEALVSPRTRLVLRLPRSHADAARALDGAELAVGTHRVRLLRPQLRELLPYSTLYAPLVVAGEAGEAAFVARLQADLDALDVPAAPVCGRWQSAEGGRLVGCSVMLSGLDPAQSLRLLHEGLGPHRLHGCGLFVPHKSAAAVGAPA